MYLQITQQDKYSRSQLLIRTFFGLFYIIIPHAISLLFIFLWVIIINFMSFLIILFTGRYPKTFFDFKVNILHWKLRLYISLLNLTDNYPAIGLYGEEPNIKLEVEHPEKLNIFLLITKTFFGLIYVFLPHSVILIFRYLISFILYIMCWFSILFTAKIPKSWFNFQVGTLRWSARIAIYLGFLTDRYPPYTGK